MMQENSATVDPAEVAQNAEEGQHWGGVGSRQSLGEPGAEDLPAADTPPRGRARYLGLARRDGVLFHALNGQQVLAIQLSLPTSLDQDSYGTTRARANTHTETTLPNAYTQNKL